jgi:hypothetical protein
MTLQTVALTTALLSAVLIEAASWATPARAGGWDLIGGRCVNVKTGKAAAASHCTRASAPAKPESGTQK